MSFRSVLVQRFMDKIAFEGKVSTEIISSGMRDLVIL